MWEWPIQKVQALREHWRTRFGSLFGVYLRAVADHWNEYFWDAFAPISPIVFWWMFGSPPVWLVALAVVWALLVAGYYTWRTDHLRLMPKLGLGNPSWQIHVANTDTGDPARFIQLVPICLSEERVEDCMAHLQRIMRWDNTTNVWVPTQFDHAVPLRWSFSDAKPHELRPGVHERINLLWVDRDYRQGLETVPRSLAEVNALQGEYHRYDIRLTAANSPAVDVSLKIGVGLVVQTEDGAWEEGLTVEQL
jgi:hypothetical protein